MNWVALQTIAQVSIEHAFNTLPAGLAIAFLAWVWLRVLRRQNAGARFALWFVTLLTVVALPALSGLGHSPALPQFVHPRFLHLGGTLPPITIPERWALFVFVAWCVGALAGLIRLTIGLWRLQKLRQSCTPIDIASLDPAVRKTLATITPSAISPSVAIATSEDVRVPAAIGLWSRTIVLPAWALRELSPADLSAIFLHEFAHLQRQDDWTNLIQKIVRALFFFHPAVWWIDGRLSVEREMACDDAVLAQTGNPHGYATCLVSLLEKSLAHQSLADPHRGWAMAHAAVSRAREASLRLAQILSKNRLPATRVWTPAVSIAGVFAVMCLAVSSHAPRFIAFDHGVTAHGISPAYASTASASVSRPLDLTAGARPVQAGLKVASTSVSDPQILTWVAAPRRTTVFTNRSRRETPSPERVVEVMNSAPAPEQFVEAREIVSQEPVPQLQTLVFIETTQYVNRGWPVIVIWRVAWISSMPGISPETSGRIPVASSI
jgi:beta-lactamase regulating signal transducer with metallopeptidase domain